MVVPLPGLAPAMLPVTVPIPQLKVLGALEDKGTLSGALLHTLALVLVVTSGAGLTPTVITATEPEQLPILETGVTI